MLESVKLNRPVIYRLYCFPFVADELHLHNLAVRRMPQAGAERNFANLKDIGRRRG